MYRAIPLVVIIGFIAIFSTVVAQQDNAPGTASLSAPPALGNVLVDYSGGTRNEDVMRYQVQSTADNSFYERYLGDFTVPDGGWVVGGAWAPVRGIENGDVNDISVYARVYPTSGGRPNTSASVCTNMTNPVWGADGVTFQFGTSAATACHLDPGTYWITFFQTGPVDSPSDPRLHIYLVENEHGNYAGIQQTWTDSGPLWTSQTGLDYPFILYQFAEPTGTVTIQKEAAPADGTDFSFTGDLGDFTLDDDSDGTLPDSMTFEVSPGDYDVYESVLADWELTDITCDDPDAESYIHMSQRRVRVDVDEGEAITCVFSNVKDGSITIVKETDPSAEAQFTFTSELPGAVEFYLFTNHPTNSNSLTRTGLAGGTYQVTELQHPDWGLREITCTGDLDNGSDIDLDDRQVDIDLDPGEDITCTFVNGVAVTTLTIVKEANPADGTDFSFSGDLGDFMLDVDSDPTYPSQQTFDVAPGTYNITEVLPPGWELDSIYCDASHTWDGNSVEVSVASDAQVTCYFYNDPGASITISQVSDPADGTDFSFSGDLGGFMLDSDNDPTLPNRMTFVDLAVGTYRITQSMPPGWILSSITCHGDTDGVTTNVGAGWVEIALQENQDIDCTFRNFLFNPGTITIVKDAVPDEDDDFIFTGGLGTFALDDDASSAQPRYETFAVPTGTYTVTESDASPNWYLADIDCVDPNGGTTTNLVTRSATISMDSNETIVCTFVNERYGQMIIRKNAPEAAPDTYFDFTGDLGAFAVEAGYGRIFYDLEAGWYDITEIVPSGWLLDGVDCDTPDAVLNGNTLSVYVAPFGDVECTFNNVRPTSSSITIIKATNPPMGTGLDFDFSGDLGAFSLSAGGSETFKVEAGTYAVTEAVPVDWLLLGVACDDADSTFDGATASINVAEDEDVTCTFYNELAATITIVKRATPSDGASFDFSGDLGDFSLMDGQNAVFTDLPAGSYAVTESLPFGWALESIVCDDPDSTGSGDTATIDLDAGESITCTFANQGVGTITIVKRATPSDGASFDFGGDLGDFSLMDGQNAVFTDLPAGTYAVTESLPPGWALESIVCDDPDSTGSGDTATIDLDPGESITCTFNNASQGTVVIEKLATPNDTGHVFNFSGDLGDFSLRHGQSATFDVPAGSYAVTELVPDGWTLKNIRCDDNTFVLNNDTVTVEVEAEQTIVCTFNNETFSGGITIYKESIPADGTSFAFGGDLGAFSLADGQHWMVTDLQPGAYTITESAAAGWFLSEVRCASTLGAVDATILANGVTVNLRSTEFVNCVFTNRQQSGIIEIIVDNWPADGTDFGFSGDLGSFVLDDAAADDGDNYGRSIAFAGLAPGSYTISELVPPNWSLLSIRCASSDPASTTSVAGSGVTVSLSGDAFVSCTFSNQASGPNREPVGPREDLGPAPRR